MAAITNPATKATEFPGEYKILSMYALAIASASETLTLSFASNHITEIQNAIVCINAGQDALFTSVACSFSSLTVTITSVGADGGAASDFTGTKVNLLVVGK
jgi:hypothetical protein